MSLTRVLIPRLHKDFVFIYVYNFLDSLELSNGTGVSLIFHNFMTLNFKVKHSIMVIYLLEVKLYKDTKESYLFRLFAFIKY